MACGQGPQHLLTGRWWRPGALVLLLVTLAPTPSAGFGHHDRETPEQALRQATELAYRKAPREIGQRRQRHSLDDWPAEIRVVVRIERDKLPIFARPGFAGRTWTVLAVAHRGELLEYLDQTQIVEFTNPLGREADGSGYWYKVRLPDGREGWLLSRPSGSQAAPFAVTLRRKVPPNMLFEILQVVGGIAAIIGSFVFWAWLLGLGPWKAAEPSVSVGDGGSGGSTSAVGHRDEDGSVKSASGIGDSGRESGAGTRKCPDCYGPAIDPFDERGDGLCSVCYGRGGGGILDDIAYQAGKLSPFGEDRRPRCSNCDGSGECPTCDGTGKI
ncbi:MAG: hypothetical protein ACRD1X_05425 [Vicinamibacteria bacterium]